MPAADCRRQVRLAGPFQQLVMIALARLGQDTSASEIRRHIEFRTGRRIAVTAVHTTLQRLAARGYTCSWTRPTFRHRPFDPDEWKHCSLSMLPIAARRFHTLQMPGRRALRLTLRIEDVLRDGLPGLGRDGELYRMCPSEVLSPWAGRPLNRRLRKRIELGLEPLPTLPAAAAAGNPVPRGA
ncbi:MAG TPA: hypothetical protein VFD43_04200 [Planctomycetota bacterium]|nr:hypothetical protein [Planctomycetota bacterium]